MTIQFDDEVAVMRRALALAERGEGYVEPNPMVGAVIVDANRRLLGEGFHERFGGSHAEVNALSQAGAQAHGSTLFVTLEPCCHQGKTPPCTRVVIEAGIRRVVVCVPDPSPLVAGRGLAELQGAGIAVEVGLCADEGARLIAPFTMLTKQGRPFVHAKWAMTLDGKIATRTGHSQWISNPQARKIVHLLRGRMDAIAVGIGTALADNPRLTARPPGPKTPLRIVIDSHARLPLDSQLTMSAREFPLLLATTHQAPLHCLDELRAAGVDIVEVPITDNRLDLSDFLNHLGQRQITNLLVEGGSELLGALFDLGAIDEIHAFIAPKLVGGNEAFSPIAGTGRATISDAVELFNTQVQVIGDNVYWHGRTGVSS